MSYFSGNANHLLIVLNSSVNFLIYCCMARRFREAFFNLVQKVALAFGSIFKVRFGKKANTIDDLNTDVNAFKTV